MLLRTHTHGSYGRGSGRKPPQDRQPTQPPNQPPNRPPNQPPNQPPNRPPNQPPNHPPIRPSIQPPIHNAPEPVSEASNQQYCLRAVGSTALRYDYAVARTGISKKTNIIESVGHLVKSCLGGGITAIHVAYSECGLWTALILNLFLGLLVCYLMYILVKCAQKTYGRIQQPTLTYPDLAEAALAICPFPKIRKRCRILRYVNSSQLNSDDMFECVSITVFSLSLISLAFIFATKIQISRKNKRIPKNFTFFVVIAKSFISMMRDFDRYDFNVRIVLLIVGIPCILICMILTLKYLAPLSIVANIFILLVVLSCVSFGIKNRIEHPETETKAFKSFGGVMKFIGVCVFSMEGVGVTLPIENSMARPTLMPRVIIIGMTIVSILVILSGFFGYWGFGENPAEPITNAFPKNWYTIILKIAMILVIWITFALNFWVPFNLVWVYLKKRHTKRPILWERIYRTIFIIVITLISVAFPSVTDLMGLIGAVCLSNMGFIYPAFIELMLDWETPGLGFLKWRLWKFAALSLFGIFVMILSAYFNGKDLIKVAISG